MGGDVEVASGRPVGDSRAAFARAGIPGSTVPPCADLPNPILMTRQALRQVLPFLLDSAACSLPLSSCSHRMHRLHPPPAASIPTIPESRATIFQLGSIFSFRLQRLTINECPNRPDILSRPSLAPSANTTHEATSPKNNCI